MKFDIKTLCPNVILNVAIITIIFLGILARLYTVKNGVGYIINDYQLLRQAINFSYFDLLTKPLEEEQASAPLYIITLKFLYSYFGLNHDILRSCVLFCSCFSLIIMPVTACKIFGNNRFGALTAVTILSFNHHILHFTQRLKQYPIDIFLTIFLILFGYVFFQKPVTKKRMIYFTIVCIICALFSYPAIIMIACLCFYYLFLLQNDNIKTKIKYFLIFIIPWFLIFIPYMFFVGLHVYNMPLMKEWALPENSHIENFEHLKSFIFYLFGSYKDYWDFQPKLTLYNDIWYLLLPITLGIFIIVIKKQRYLFSVLVLPVIISQILGIIHIYPLTGARVSLWILPVFILLFITPGMYIKFNKKIITWFLSLIIIFYYLQIFDKDSYHSVKNFFQDYNFPQNTVNIFMEELRKSDISAGDVIYIHSENSYPALFDVFDPKGDFKNNQIIDIHFIECEDCNDRILPKTLPENKNIYIYLYKDKYDEFDRENYELIKNNTNIIYEYKTWFGDKFIKTRRKND